MTKETVLNKVISLLCCPQNQRKKMINQLLTSDVPEHQPLRILTIFYIPSLFPIGGKQYKCALSICHHPATQLVAFLGYIKDSHLFKAYSKHQDYLYMMPLLYKNLEAYCVCTCESMMGDTYWSILLETEIKTSPWKLWVKKLNNWNLPRILPAYPDNIQPKALSFSFPTLSHFFF